MSGRKCSGIDIDTVGPDLDFMHRRMPVNDDLAEVGVRGKKLLPYPKQITLLLIGQIDIGLHACMREEKITQYE